MKKFLFLLLSCSIFRLEAAHFQSAMSVTPIKNKDSHEFLVEIQIEKVAGTDAPPQLIASPKLVCIQGKPAQFTIESDDKAEILTVQILIPDQPSSPCVQASLLMKEKGHVVLSLNNTLMLNPDVLN